MPDRSARRAALVVLALACLAVAAHTMLTIPTMILSQWFLLLLYFPAFLLISYLLAVLTRKITRSRVDLVSGTSFFIVVFSLWFYGSQYRPTYTILLPASFTGPVRLFISGTGRDELSVNTHGIGYIARKAYRSGFKARLLRDGQDISDSITSVSKGSFSSADIHGKTLGPYSFVCISIGSNPKHELPADFQQLIQVNALDTMKAAKY